MNRWQRWRGFLLVWLSSSLLSAGYVFWVVAQDRLPNWLDALIFAGWIALASRWLALVMEWLQRRWLTRWVAIAVPLAALLVIAFIVNYLALAIGNYYLQGTVTITVYFFYAAGLALALGMGLTALALLWRVAWQALLSTPTIVNLWARLYNPVKRVWTGLRRTRAWHWLRRGLAWGLMLLLALDAVGVLLAARPTTVEWEPILTTGFPSGRPRSVSALAVGPDGESIFAGTGGGVFRSDDGGQTWQAVNAGLTSLSVRALAVGPDGESIFAGTSSGVFRSADGGETWQAAKEGLTSRSVMALAVRPDGERFFAGTWGGGVFRSDDGGETWQAVNEGLTELYVSALAVEPDGESIFAGTSSGVFRSADGGETWQAVSEGLTSLHVYALAVGPDGESIFAGTRDGGVFRSDDGGQTWQTVNDGLTSLYVLSLAVGPDGESLFAGTDGGGVFRSDDGGETWQVINQGLTYLDVWALAVGPDGESLFAGTSGGGVFRSADGGQTWQAVNAGLTELHVMALAVGPDGESIFAGAYGGGVFRSADRGQTWQAVNQGLTELHVMALAVGPDGEMLFAGTVMGEVFRSDDGCQSWQAAKEGLTSRSVMALAVGPDGESIFAGTYGGGVFRSADGGQTWQAVNEGLTELDVLSLAVGPDGESIFAWTDGGVFRSDDGGQNWQAVNEGLTDLDVGALAVGPDGESLFTGTRGVGVFRSDDGGQTWQAVNEGLTSLGVGALAVGPDGESIFAGTDGGGVFRSDDGGETWQAVNQGLTYLDVWALAVGPDGERIFAGTDGGGVFRSDDGGQTWQAVNAGLTSLDVRALAVGPDGENLFAVTSGSVFRSDDEGMSWQPAPDLSTEELPTNPAFEEIRLAASEDKVSLTRPGMGWLRWATHRYQSPQAIAIRGNTVTLYASAGAAMILRAEVPLPIIWGAPTPYLALVAATWRGLEWAGANAVPLSVGLGLAAVVASLYIYAGVARPNRLRPATVLWLLPRPRHLLVASGYRGYAERWAAGDPLERLALLQAPVDTSFGPAQVETELRYLGAAFDTEGLLAALAALLQRGLLVQEDNTWRLAEPLLAQVQRRELPGDEPARLAEQIRAQHPLYARTRNFIAQARFRMRELGAEEFLLTPYGQAHPQAGYGPAYSRLIAGRPPTGDDFTAVCKAARRYYGDDMAHRVALVISDRRPEPGARYRLYEIRQREGLAIVPLDVSLFGQIKPNRTAGDILAAEIDQATGRQNLYAISGPVSGDLSFFGRERVLQEIIDLLDAGQPVGLFGLRKVGKTSLIQRLQGRLDQRRPIALVDTQTTARQQGVWPLYPVIVAGFVAHLERTRPDLALPDLRLWNRRNQVFRKKPGFSPATAESFLQDLHALHAALGQPEARERLLLIVDEVDRLFPSGETPGYEGFAAFFGQLRAANQQARLLDFVVVGVNPGVNRRERWQDTDNELYRALREVWMPPMSPQDVQEMIESLGAQMGVRYEPGALHLLAQAGGGQPFVTRQMCSLAVEGRLGREVVTVTMDQAQAAIEEFVSHDPYLRELWRTRLDDTQREMLCALAQAVEPILRTRLLPPAQRQAALVALGALEERTLVRRDEGGYTIAWDVFRDWIRWVELGLEE